MAADHGLRAHDPVPPAILHARIRQAVPATITPNPENADQAILEHSQTRIRYAVNASSAFIWTSLAEDSDGAALAARVATEFGIAMDVAVDAVARFVDRMGALGFVTVDDGSPAADLRARYLDLIKKALVNRLYAEHELRIEWLERNAPQPDTARRLRDMRDVDRDAFEDMIAHKADGRVWKNRVARFSHTMIGLRRLQNLEWCAARIFAEGIPGDFLEAGVCQGGAAIFLRALQVSHGEGHRLTWVADSFQGLPEPSLEIDEPYQLQEAVQPWLAASQQAVEENFRTYDLLSDEVRFLPGWFAESLPHAPVGALALLRIDADLYASTWEVLESLYDRVVSNGFVIVDDYFAFRNCREAVDRFRAERGITDPLIRIDWTAVFWRKA